MTNVSTNRVKKKKRMLNAISKKLVPIFPAKGIVVVKSKRYKGEDEHYDEIKRLFQSLTWPSDVKCIYVSNGWCEGFVKDRMVSYCGYACNVDDEKHRQNYRRL